MTPPRKVIRVAIVEDHALVRRSLKELVETSHRYEIVAEAGDTQNALPLLRGTEPDIVLVDIGLPGRSGIDLADQIHEELPSIDVIFVSMHDDDRTLQQAMAVDPAGFVPKAASGGELLEALDVVAGGDAYISPELAGRVMQIAAGRLAGPVQEMTDREIDVLRLLAAGYRQREIADHLFVSIKTVKNHLTSVYTKLGVDRAAQAVAEAYRLGIIRPGEDPEA